ncbi:hypothetical protein, partial [Stenomitos frigidus]
HPSYKAVFSTQVGTGYLSLKIQGWVEHRQAVYPCPIVSSESQHLLTLAWLECWVTLQEASYMLQPKRRGRRSHYVQQHDSLPENCAFNAA